MGSFRGKGNAKGKGGGSAGFTRPKLPGKKGRGKKNADGAVKKSPLAQHFFFWIVLISMFMAVFGVFQTQIQSVILWNDVYTLFGAIDYWTATIGWLITMIVAMSLDMILVSK